MLRQQLIEKLKVTFARWSKVFCATLTLKCFINNTNPINSNFFLLYFKISAFWMQQTNPLLNCSYVCKQQVHVLVQVLCRIHIVRVSCKQYKAHEYLLFFLLNKVNLKVMNSTNSLWSSNCIYTSPWYNRNGWLGVKYQLTYLLVFINSNFDSESHTSILVQVLPCRIYISLLCRLYE